MTLYFKTDDERRQLLADTFELDTADLHPNTREFYTKYLAQFDSERMSYLIELVEHAKHAARRS
ncbi:hypothetical protein H0B56_12865 [Haloechinothrix sp. YIM 98757]|uniref:Uncharacterized protein n=1 Tax=Haloechinothrix aidingensis TaxID=2752311 RepID=A0A838AB19_9PSEU|nr:hypothetical protein [Haloechinothrix aidingensis]MBA0126434.1 hypothetical protein [Haloechinothrix aidingensis]